MKLELKHLVCYLPYKLKILDIPNPGKFTMSLITIDLPLKESEYYKPILRPLSDLNKELEINGENFYPIGKLHNSSYRRHGGNCKGEYEVLEERKNVITTKKHSFSHGVTIHLEQMDENKNWINNYLLKWHFDIFNLLDKGLAININNVKP